MDVKRWNDNRVTAILPFEQAIKMVPHHCPAKMPAPISVFIGVAAWELIQIHAPQKLYGIKFTGHSTDIVDGNVQVTFYPVDTFPAEPPPPEVSHADQPG